MDAFPLLGTTAEISITFAGFISLFFVLAKRDGSLEPEVAVLIRFILMASLGTLFLAALPMILSGLGASGSSLWRTSSAVGLAVGTSSVFFAASQRRALRDRQVTVFAWVGWTLATLGLLIHGSNIVGWPRLPSGGMYLSAIWTILAIGSVNLVDLVFRFALDEPAA